LTRLRGGVGVAAVGVGVAAHRLQRRRGQQSKLGGSAGRHIGVSWSRDKAPWRLASSPVGSAVFSGWPNVPVASENGVLGCGIIV